MKPIWFDRLLQWLLATLLIFTPLAFGTVEAWSIAVAELLVLSMGVVWIIRMIVEGRIQFEKTSCNLPIILFLALILFQMVPMPMTVIKYLSPTAYAMYRQPYSAINPEIGWRTISLDPTATRKEFVEVLTYALLFWVILNNFRQRQQIEAIIAIIVGVGLLLAVLGIFQYYYWNGRIYWIRKLSGYNQVFGPYVNRNHFAGYMEIVIPWTMGYLLSQLGGRGRVHALWAGLRRLTPQQPRRMVFLLCAAMLMTASLLLTGSRGGLISFLSSMVLFAVIMRMQQPLDRKWSGLVPTFCGLALIVTILIGGTGAFLSVERLAKGIQEPTREARLMLWQDTMRLAKDFPILGCGFNTFKEVFPAYQTSALQSVFLFAHNDYLQLLAEGGVVALGLVVWFLVAWYWEILVRGLKQQDAFVSHMTLAGMTAAFAMAIHSLTDFNLHIPANAIVFVAVLAATLNTGRLARR